MTQSTQTQILTQSCFLPVDFELSELLIYIYKKIKGKVVDIFYYKMGRPFQKMMLQFFNLCFCLFQIYVSTVQFKKGTQFK